MAPRKSRESVLELCTKVTILGNSVSVRMLEFLSTVKHQPHGFRELAHDFLDSCRILWSIEAGLTETNRTANQFPVDMINELDKKFRQTNDDFTVLNQMLTRYLEYERKGALGKLQKGWRAMFADDGIAKMRDSLAKSRDALRMSALVFRWSLGEAKADASVGIGYTGLAAALERMDQKTPSTVIPASHHHEQPALQQPHLERQLPPEPQLHQEHNDIDRYISQVPQDRMHAEMPPQLPPMDLHDRASGSNISLRDIGRDPSLRETNGTHTTMTSQTHNSGSSIRDPSISIRDPSLSITTYQSYPERQSSRSSKIMGVQMRERTLPSTTSGSLHGEQLQDDNISTHTTETETLIEELIQEIDLSEKGSATVTRIKADPATVPRWTPRNTIGANNAQLKSALLTAIQQKKHKIIEQLLDRGVSPEAGPEFHAIKEAVLIRDTETIRLLLLFGGDPNARDRNGVTPLMSATELSFVEGAKMLIKYGADPNLSAGPEEESPLAMAVVHNKLEFVQLFLMYGGDPNAIMENGNTVFIRAMNKDTPKKLVELMLNYGADPNCKNAEGTSPLFQAISSNRLDLMTLLLDRGADPNLPGPKHLLWPSAYKPHCLKLLLSRGADLKKAPGVLELATSLNNLESVKILLQAGVDVNTKKDGVYTPLCSSIRDNRMEIFQLLITNNADPNLPASDYPVFKAVTRPAMMPYLVAAGADLSNPKGILERAVHLNNRESLMYLLDQGVDPNAKSAEGHTPLTTAIREDRGEFVDLLLARGADPGIRGREWPICMAVKRPAILKKLLPAVKDPRAFKGVVEMAVVANQLESVKLLLGAGVSVEDKNGGVFSPLTTAIREERKEIVKYLLDEGGADVNAPGEHLPIIKAIRRCRGDDTEIIEMLLARGADVNLVYRGWNAIMQALENGDANILTLLVEKGNGVDLQAKDDSGRTVMDIASSRGWDEAVAILLSGRDRR
ncbi:Ankyrin [Pleurostoma richardsiae]|uniref:Ankyrin n=1 Tax=Pleurostoma richardsiae TaxID=41990 RepID=A0AA38VI97_9PEZI|nr:Ankyrin [Pleurostoma richardsiae]